MIVIVKAVAVFILACIAAAQPNYQQRVIYYSEEDNVCRFGAESDSINLIINIDNHSTIKANMAGNTLCQPASSHLAAIKPSSQAVFSSAANDTEIRFNQTTISQ